MPRGVSRYDEALRQGRLWTPQSIPASSLKAWIDIEDMRDITVSGVAVTVIKDKSGNGNTLTANSTGPDLTQDLSYPFVRKPGLNVAGGEWMSFASSVSYSGATGISVAVAYINNGGQSIIGGSSAGGFQLVFGGSVVAINRRSQANLVNSSNSAIDGVNIIGADCSTNVSTVWLNGTSTTAAVDPAFTSGVVRMFDAGGEFGIGKFFEAVVISGVLPLSARLRLDGYLAWKWGAQHWMAASHPFKNRPPLIGD